MTRREKGVFGVLVLAGVASLSTLLAQRAVNTQVNTMVSHPALTQSVSGSVRYSNRTSVPMRSELRHAYWQSGSTPSDVRFSYSQLGARAPGGPMRYIDSKPSYLAPKSSGPPPRAPQPMGSVRYASPPPPSRNLVNNQVASARVMPSGIGSSGVRSSGVAHTAAPISRVSSTIPPSQGTVRYARY